MKRTLLIVLSLAVLAGSGPGAAPRADAADPIPVGVAVAQTSNVALFGQEQVIGAQIAEEYLNQKGGVNGRPIKLIFQDTAGDEAGAINAFQNLINVAKVVAIVGPTLSQQAFAADPIANKAGVPVVGPSNTAAGIPQIGEFISRVSAPVTQIAPHAVQAAMGMNPNLKRVAVLFAQNDAFSKSETQVFQQTVKDNPKLELVTVQTFQTTDTDFTAQTTNVLAAKPDLVIISGLAADGGNLVKQLRELGYKGLIVGGNGFNTANLFPVCKALCDGILVAQAYSYQAPGEVNQAFRAVYKEKQKKEPPQFSAQSFTAVQVVVDALRALDKKTPIASMDLAKLRAELNKQLVAGTYQTPLGEISFKPSPGGEIIQKDFYIAQIKMEPDGAKGAFVFLPKK
jgi:branched-chain amino acid transport system substrate-binding protein